MSAVQIVAIVLVVAGILGLVYGTFSYTKETHDVKLGARVVGAGEADGQRPDLGWCGGDCGWRRAPASCTQEKLGGRTLHARLARASLAARCDVGWQRRVCALLRACHAG